MAAVACLLLFLFFSIAGHATPLSSLATGWPDGPNGSKATAMVWPPLACSAEKCGTAEPDEMLVKRTSRSPSKSRWLPHLQGTGLEQVPPNHVPPPALAAYIQGGPDHSTATSSQVPADAPVVAQTKPGSSTKRHYNVNRRPRGSLKNKPALQLKAQRENYASMIQRIKDGKRIDKTKPDGSESGVMTFEEYLAHRRALSSRWWRNLNDEDRVKLYRQKNENARLNRAKRKAQREAQKEGRIWQGSPIRRGRPRKYGHQEQVRAEEGHEHAPVPTAEEEGDSTQHAPPGAHGSGALRHRTPESSSGSWLVPASHHTNHRVAPGPSSSSLDLLLSLSVPGSSTSEQRQSRTPQQPTPPPVASTREEEQLQLTLAPPNHD